MSLYMQVSERRVSREGAQAVSSGVQQQDKEQLAQAKDRKFLEYEESILYFGGERALWNRLLGEILESSSPDVFKAHLDAILCNIML